MNVSNIAKLAEILLLLHLITFIHIIRFINCASDTISTNQTIRNGETIVSSDGTFELGFFSPGNSSRNRYVGMWYRNIPIRTYVWVANREVPSTNSTGVVLRVQQPGILVLLNETNGIIWSTNTSRMVQNPVAQLLDSGNLVIRDASDDNRPENFLWQSFDYPTDTFLPDTKYGWNLVTGFEIYFSSWRSEDDPAHGQFSFHLDPTGYLQLLMKRGSVVVHRSGPWNGLVFSGMPYSRENPSYRMRLVMNKNEIIVSRSIADRSIISRTVIGRNGVAQRFTWVNRTQEWVLIHNLPADVCDWYRSCGAHGICNVESSPSCGCLDRFVPKNLERWNGGDWSDGCVRRTNLSCVGDRFLKYSGIKLPDSRYSRVNESMSLEECGMECLRNCNCSAYTYLDISNGGSGCLLYFGDLVDIRSLSQDGQDLYIRMASSESDPDAKGRLRIKLIASIIPTVVGVVLLGLSLTLYIRKRKTGPKLKRKGSERVSHAEDSDLPLFKLSTILESTNHFSDNNKLGEGGFGPVYKGMLAEGQEIAVKRLSTTSMQGLDELKNEVIVIAKLQHRNLVRLLGCCIEGEENMLIYEYMPNKSLDLMLFDQTKSKILDWPKRYHIINGIARGLLYLHQDSRLRIIHRDLKASNILLDSDMNPKISDFGMAKTFGGNETEAKTRRVVGTYGYMSPEYAMYGLFSLKSDVYSFGVLLLEIMSGMRNKGYSNDEHKLYLLEHAWTLYREGRSAELLDTSLRETFDLSAALRAIHVGLLCVQSRPEDRPTMSSVIFMLGNEVALPEAKHPGFFTEKDVFVGQKLIETDGDAVNSVNEVSITLPWGRRMCHHVLGFH